MVIFCYLGYHSTPPPPPANTWTLAPASKSLSSSSCIKQRSLTEPGFSQRGGQAGVAVAEAVPCLAGSKSPRLLGGWEGKKGGFSSRTVMVRVSIALTVAGDKIIFL